MFDIPHHRHSAWRIAALSTVAAGTFALTSSEASAQGYNLTTTTGTYQTIAATGTRLATTDPDDGYGTIMAPFAFQFYGQPVAAGTSLYVNTNGVFNVLAQDTSYMNVAIPNPTAPNGFVAPFWMDLYVPTTGGIFWQSSGPIASQTLVIEWTDVTVYAMAMRNERLSFQIRIHQGTNVIEIVYGPRTAGTTTFRATVGVENHGGTAGVPATCAVAAACTLAEMSFERLLVYTPIATTTGPDLTIPTATRLPAQVQPGGSYSITYDVQNIGNQATTLTTDLTLFASRTSPATNRDTSIGTVTIPTVGAGQHSTGTLRATIPSAFSGTYYLSLIVNSSRRTTETNYNNNTYDLGSITAGTTSGITITTTSLPHGRVNDQYSFQLMQSGAVSPTWTLVSGTLPPSITLSTTGLLSGRPSAAGSRSLTFRASESTRTPGMATLSLVIDPATSNIQLTTTSLPQATVGEPYQTLLGATGGMAPYAFQVIQGLPSWLQVDSSGALSGTPDAPGVYSLMVSIFDSRSQSGNGTARLEIVDRPNRTLSINGNLPSGSVGVPYSAGIVGGGTAPYSFQMTSGMMPPGLSFDSGGLLVGSPGMGGSFAFGVSAMDSSSPPLTGQGQISINIEQRMGTNPVRITSGRDITVYINAETDLGLGARDGTPPYTWSVVTGALQPGLRLDASQGHIMGKVMRASTATITLGVVDSMGTRDQAMVYVHAVRYHASGGGGRINDDRGGGCSCSGAGGSAGLVDAGALAGIALGLVMLGLRRRRR